MSRVDWGTARVYLEVAQARLATYVMRGEDCAEGWPARDYTAWLDRLATCLGELPDEATCCETHALVAAREVMVQVAATACAWIDALDEDPGLAPHLP